MTYFIWNSSTENNIKSRIAPLISSTSISKYNPFLKIIFRNVHKFKFRIQNTRCKNNWQKNNVKFIFQIKNRLWERSDKLFEKEPALSMILILNHLHVTCSRNCKRVWVVRNLRALKSFTIWEAKLLLMKRVNKL